MNDLINKLKNSGLIKSAQEVVDSNESSTNKQSKLEEIYTGEWDYQEHGDVFIMHDTIPYGNNHGKVRLEKNNDPSALFTLENINQDPAQNFHSIVFFDIETSNLSFGAGSFVFLIGLCYFSMNGVETKLLLIDQPGAEWGLLEKFIKEISAFDILASYNGKSFDAPFIRNRLAFYHDKANFEEKNHIDLLTYARRLWKLRLENCKLSDIERDVLKFSRDSAEIPGWLVPQVYFDYLHLKDAQLLDGVIYHNKMDVISLAALFQRISIHLQIENAEKGAVDIRDQYSLAKLYAARNDYEKALAVFQECVIPSSPNDIPAHFFLLFGLVLKRLGRLEEAASIWEESIPAPGFLTCIELSKYYEHTEKQYNQAYHWAQSAKDIILQKDMGKTTLKKELDAVEHRLARILRKQSL